MAVVVDGDASALLAPVLKGEECKKSQSADFAPGSDCTEYPASLFGLVTRGTLLNFGN
jgi:hypothetical protein